MFEPQSLLLGLRRRFFRRDFDRYCRAVLKTRAVELDSSSNLVVLSQSYHKDLLMFLVAAKSFARFVPPAKFILVDDGFTTEDRRLIAHHLSKVEFIPREGISAPNCPVGGTWERLLTIADRSQAEYVIQLDSDTVTIAEPVEVKNYISSGTSFTLSTRQGRAFVTTQEASVAVESNQSSHVQILAERSLGSIPQLRESFYIRGCSGFAGFAPSAINRDKVENISTLMIQALGANVWSRWGSEQFASNFLIANAQSKGLLPFESYPYWEPGIEVDRAAVIHFIGDHRFMSSAYRRVAMKVINTL